MSASVSSSNASTLTVGDLNSQTKICINAMVDQINLPAKAQIEDFYSEYIDVERRFLHGFTSSQSNDQLKIEWNTIWKANFDMSQGPQGKYFIPAQDGWLKKGLHLTFCNDCFTGENKDIWLALPSGIPYYDFKWEPSDFGEITGDQRKIVSLKLDFPNDFSYESVFENAYSGLKTNVRPDYRKLESCLNSLLNL